ncbi:polysaccharide pyruvyl transferase family protein [Acinetobacter sp. YH12025]|uniref:polysaccharide pyruvyl transferase family protein n=1 Tax=Acinetobacter sp. YH12025 TaxID=2601042 RepID=UPI0015D291AA|nr:polysaccharide pyruvyl transferase family protein [Acinetobacter sp. YH12025]
MKKVAILTQPLHTNYGGTLQNYALQQVLKDLNFSVETVNCAASFESDFKKSLRELKNWVLGKRKYTFSAEEMDLVQFEHKRFISERISLSKRIKNKAELREYFCKNDIKSIVVGSDQVWRKEYSPDIMSFFLDFETNAKKISYAASFGVDYWQYSSEETKRIKSLLNEFHMISVREDDGVKLLSDNVQIESNFVLDPTLLLSKKRYMELIDSSIDKKDMGIFCYMLDKNKDKLKIVEHVKNTLGMHTYECMPKIKEKLNKEEISDISEYQYPAIESWLESFHGSNFVITDSFHGTVFSIIFNKPFITISNKERGNSRFISLLKLLNLEYRMISKVEDITAEHFLKPDFESVNDIIKIRADECKKLIYMSLNG